MPYPILADAEPFTFQGGAVGVLLLHGFTGSPQVLLPLLKHVLPSTPGIGSDIADSPLKELAYERVPLKALAAARALQAIVKAELGRVAQPLLLYVSRRDHVVPPGHTSFIAE